MQALPKIVVIVGPTASGKTKLGIELAKKYNGEIVSADSRQIYKKMDIASARPHGEWRWRGWERVYMVEGVPHYMMDIVDPGKEMTLADYQAQANKHIQSILHRGKLPIIVGGTGLYVWALVDNLQIPKIAPNKKLRKSFEDKSPAALGLWLQKIDPEAYASIDIHNPRRVMRALEVAIMSGESFTKQQTKLPPLYEALQIGVACEGSELDRRIEARIDEQIADGLVAETEALVKQKYGWQLPSMSSIGYPQMRQFLEGVCTMPEARSAMIAETKRFVKRQLTWFRRDERIKWLAANDTEAIDVCVKNFLT